MNPEGECSRSDVSNCEWGASMTKYLAMAFVVAAALSTVTPVEARGGCGIGWHRGPHGGFARNGAAIMFNPHAGDLVIAPRARVCRIGWHLGPFGPCRRN